MKSKIGILGISLFLLLGSFLGGADVLQAKQKTNIYFFWGFGCPHCLKEKEFLNELAQKYPDLEIKRYEIYFSVKNQKLLEKAAEKLGFDSLGVPLTIVGDEAFVGFSAGVNDHLIESRVKECLAGACPDQMSTIISPTVPVQPSVQESPRDEGKSPSDGVSLSDGGGLRVGEGTTTSVATGTRAAASTSPLDGLELPIFGSLDLQNYSLPVLAILLGGLDGFNPCAMWALIFLISLLLRLEDRRRMWLLGSAFIVTSAVVYFIFMAAWLNLIIFLGFIWWIKFLIGLVAIFGGGYNLWEFFKNKSGVCQISESQKQIGTFEKLKNSVQKKNLWLALGGIMALAFAVNLVELVCSAGFPAVFTQVLALNNLPIWQYYLYILLYIFFFMVDDLVVFFVSMTTLRLTGLTTKYSRFSRLLGGILMVMIGLLLIFRPEWLLFG